MLRLSPLHSHTLTPPGWPIIEFARSESGTHFIYPDTRTPRFVLPLDRRARRAGLSFFVPATSRALLFAKWLSCVPGRFRKVAHLSGTKVMGAIKTLGGCTGVDAGAAVIKLGTPGPYTKNTVLLLDHQQLPVAVAKTGNTAAARDLLKNEAQWLRTLANNSVLPQQCPALLEEQQLDEAYVIVQSAGIGRFSDHSLCDSHIDFLSSFQKLFLDGNTYQACKMRQDMLRRFASLRNKLSRAWVDRTEQALGKIEDGLRDKHVLLVAAHRDFSPWNMRHTARGLFVFDWEYASTGYLPLYDLFHFLLMPMAVRNAISLTRVRATLRTVRKYGSGLEHGTMKIGSIDIQLLAYLVDLSLMYLESRNGKDAGYVVLDRYAYLIDTFERWRTA